MSPPVMAPRLGHLIRVSQMYLAAVPEPRGTKREFGAADADSAKVSGKKILESPTLLWSRKFSPRVSKGVRIKRPAAKGDGHAELALRRARLAAG